MKSGELFEPPASDDPSDAPSPLAERMRPRRFEEFVGQASPRRRRLGAREQKKRIRDIPGYTGICRGP